MNEKFLLIFDIPEERANLKRKINRELYKGKAEFVQQSVWRSENLEVLKRIADKIKSEGARASVIREEIIL